MKNLIITTLILTALDYFIFTSQYFLFPLIGLYQALGAPTDESIFNYLIEGLIVFLEIISILLFVRKNRAEKN
jgi:hypothetical protein